MARPDSAFPQPSERGAILTARRNVKMARSAHAYVRGSTTKFYEWLKTDNGLGVPHGPPVWICGDCHAGNLGPVADAEGRIEVQIRDLDQTVIGNPAHDLIRLGLSLATAARGSDLPGVTTARMIEQMIEGYQEALAEEKAGPEEKRSAKKRSAKVDIVMDQAIGRTWKQLAKERIEDTKPTIPLGSRFWPLSAEEKSEIARLFEEDEVRRLVTSMHFRDDDARIELLDAAYWMKGCSSLGLLRFAVLVGVKTPAQKESGFCLIDIKEAIQAVAPRSPRAKMPRDNADRVVTGARHLSPSLGERMLATRMMGRTIFMRELLPQDLKLEIDQISQDEAVRSARHLAGIVGKAHATQMDDEIRATWRKELQRNHSKNLDAPSWLWSSIVELVVSHEAAYLDHCRRYAAEPMPQRR